MSSPESFAPVQVDAVIKDKAMAEFEDTWADYNSATAAAIDIASRYGIGKTTLVDWLRVEDRWPATARRLTALERENARLRRINEQLRLEVEELRQATS
jgi:hypothetical protein